MSTSPGHESETIRLLFVDDSRTSRDFYTRLFTKAGYLVQVATDVDDAINKLEAGRFDIAIIDFFMPQKTGDVLCRHIREDSRTRSITTAILTATYSDDLIRTSLEAGASDCLFKDEPVELLLARLEAMVRSITVRKTIEWERRYLQRILGSLNEGVYGVDEHNRITFMNPAGLKLLGYEHESELVGQNPHQAFHYALQDGRPNPAETCYLHQAYELGDELPNWESVFWTRDRRPIWVECNVVPLRTGDRLYGSVVAFRDITMLREHIEKLNWQAYHDSLTHLPNRRYFREALEREFYRLKRSEETSGVLYIDLDHFKTVNDRAGHAAGDQLLVEVGRLLSKRIRVVDVLARLGGDEFGIILQNVDRDSVVSIAQTFQELLANYSFEYEGQRFAINGSIGISLMDKDAVSPEHALMQADTASYASKKRGGHQVRMYSPGDESAVA